jgi:hypothetical protein
MKNDPCNLIQYFRDGEHCGEDACKVRKQGCPCTMTANRLEQLETDLQVMTADFRHTYNKNNSLMASNKDLHEQVAFLESKEVCAKPHNDFTIDGCPFCKIEYLNDVIDRHFTRLQLEQSRTQALSIENHDLRESLKLRDMFK